MFLNRSCKEVASLIVHREDRALGLLERLAVRGHMFICVTCPIFERQILTLRNATRQWRAYSETDLPTPMARTATAATATATPTPTPTPAAPTSAIGTPATASTATPATPAEPPK